MRYLIAALLLVGVISPVSAGTKDDAFAVIEQFKKSYDASDPPAIVKLFAPRGCFFGNDDAAANP
jgi:hypothetical protein